MTVVMVKPAVTPTAAAASAVHAVAGNRRRHGAGKTVGVVVGAVVERVVVMVVVEHAVVAVGGAVAVATWAAGTAHSAHVWRRKGRLVALAPLRLHDFDHSRAEGRRKTSLRVVPASVEEDHLTSRGHEERFDAAAALVCGKRPQGFTVLSAPHLALPSLRTFSSEVAIKKSPFFTSPSSIDTIRVL